MPGFTDITIPTLLFAAPIPSLALERLGTRLQCAYTRVKWSHNYDHVRHILTTLFVRVLMYHEGCSSLSSLALRITQVAAMQRNENDLVAAGLN